MHSKHCGIRVFINFSLIIFIVIFIFPACKTTGKLGGKKLKKRKPDFLLEQLRENRKSAEWLSAKAAIAYRDDNQRIKITSYVRMRKDSLIWMNVKKLGVEAARVQITPDSIYVLDRLNKEYLVKPFDFVSEQFQMPQAVRENMNFQALQNLFLGNPVFIPVETFESSIELDHYQLDGTYDNIECNYQLRGEDYELKALQFVDNRDKKEVEFSFDDYQTLDNGQKYSYFRNIKLMSEQTGNVDMSIQLSKLELDVPKTIRFEVPSRYTRID